MNRNNTSTIRALSLASFVVTVIFMWQGNNGFSLSDEGFLWYGTQRVMLGDVPIRDFMAYDPGRYYWSAALMGLWGDSGIMALRGAVAIFQLIGLFVGLLLIDRTVKKQNFLYLLLSATTMVVWMFPRHKLFDISLSILLIGVLAFLVQHQTKKRYFLAGLCVGLAAVFGRNHGMYGVAGSVGVMAWLSIKRGEGPGLVKSCAIWSAGVIVGFLPILFMALLMPGFAKAFWGDILFLFERGGTNLFLPIPYPWRVDFTSVPLGEAIRGVLVGLFFIGTIAFGVLSIIWIVWQKNQKKHVAPALVAASCLALPYAHYAYSRAEINHLAQGIFPLLVGCLVLLASQPAKIKWPLALMLCTSSLWVMCVFHPGWRCHINKQCVDAEVSGSNLQVDSGTASIFELLRKLTEKYAPDGQSFVVTPSWPSAYALLERKSPMWANYTLFPRSKNFQMKEIERIRMANPRFVLILDIPVDGHDDLRFRNSHSEINRYIESEFQRIDGETNNPSYLLFVKKNRPSF